MTGTFLMMFFICIASLGLGYGVGRLQWKHIMTVYMLRDNNTGLFYRRTKGNYTPSVWVEQEKASVWTMKNGPAQAKSLYLARYRIHHKPVYLNLEIVPFELTEIQ